MAGRLPDIKKELEEERVVDAVLSLWQNEGDILKFQQIHESLVNKGIVQKANYRYKTIRILDHLERKGFIEKLGRGRYRIKVDPLEFRLFDTLERIRREKGMATVSFGGYLWTGAEIHLLGFPEKALSYSYVDFALQYLSARLCRLFAALQELLRMVESKGENGYLPETVLDELILELPAYYLSRAGIDADGLSTRQYLEIMKKVVDAIPERIEEKEMPGLADFTNKELMAHTLNFLNETFNRLEKKKEEMFTRTEEKHIPYNIFEDEKADFALVITPPEWLLDENGYEKRQIIETIEDNADLDPLFIARSLVSYNKDIVLSVLKIEGLKILGKAKAEAVEDFFKKLIASKDLVDLLFCAFSQPTILLKAGQPNVKRILRKAKKKAKQYAREYGAEEIIMSMPLFQKFRAVKAYVKRLFSEVPLGVMETWLQEGERKYQEFCVISLRRFERYIEEYKISEGALNDMAKYLEREINKRSQNET